MLATGPGAGDSWQSTDTTAPLAVCAVRCGLPTERGDRWWRPSRGGHRAAGRRDLGREERGPAQTPLACALHAGGSVSNRVPATVGTRCKPTPSRGAVGPDRHLGRACACLLTGFASSATATEGILHADRPLDAGQE